MPKKEPYTVVIELLIDATSAEAANSRAINIMANTADQGSDWDWNIAQSAQLTDTVKN